jgi:ribonucleoside-diphosphate reductase alpha chain
MFKTELAYETWKSKYRYGNETPLETFQRVAKALASVEKNPDEWYDKFLKTMVRFNEKGEAIGLKCTTGGRITANIGTSFKKATLLNCFSGDTQYYDVNCGIVSFSEMCGKSATVLTKKGIFKAEIKCFGVQKTYDVFFRPAYLQNRVYDFEGHFVRDHVEGSTIKRSYYLPANRSSYKISVTVTKDHRWLLDGGVETTELKIGDIVESCVYKGTEDNEDFIKGKIHGLIFGDGSVSYIYTNACNSSGKFGLTRYSVRLCGKKQENIKYFNSDDIKYHPSCLGDPTCYYVSEKKLKAPPVYGTENLDYIRGFFNGLIATDGCHWYGDKKIYEISTTNSDVAEWLKMYAHAAGYIVTGFRIDSNMETNFGKRSDTIKRVTLSEEIIKWKVSGIVENEEQEVFCAVVPEEHAFTLANGLYTGNCFVGAPVSNAHIKYIRKTEDGSIQFPVEYKTDDNPDDLINIFLTIVEQAKTLASEGGYGLNFDFIRPRGSLIKGTGIKHPGVVSYMKIWDSVSECIVQGDMDGYVDKIKNHLKSEEAFQEVKRIVKNTIRKGAMLASLSVTHPDCEEFVRAKQTSGVLTKFNISVLLTGDFMRSVEADELFDQSFNGVIYKKVKARDLYNLIMKSCYDRAEPGVLYADNMMKNNPIAYLGQPKATNPCVTPDTKILTDKGDQSIVFLEGKRVNVWNGRKFSSVLVEKTGTDQKILRIIFSNDSHLDCTFYHKFYLSGAKKVEAKDLRIGDSLEAYKLPGIEDSILLSVKEIVPISELSDVYCFSEPELQRGTFNGIVTAQCGEIPGLSSITTVCLLGSPNLTSYVKIDKANNTYFDYKEYSEDVIVFMRMLDNVNDLTYAPLPSYQWVVENLRQVGMGINGLGSTLMMLGIPYNSKEAVDFSKNICEIKENLTWQTSALLAKEKGVFTAYKKKDFESTEYFASDRISEETKNLIRKYGVRNSKTTTVPPLGNSSLLSDITSNGIEPVYLLEYERKVVCREWPEGLTTDNIKEVLKYHKEKDFEYWKGSYKDKSYYYEPHNRGLCEINTVRDFGYQWLLDNFPNKDHSAYLVTTKDLKIEDHLAVQEVVQHYNNQSTSKTCNLPNKFPFEDFKSLYIRAWKAGLNGFTTYREGSMESVLSSVTKSESHEIVKKDIKLPNIFINGPTHIMKKEGKKFYLNFSYLPEDTKFEFPIVLWIHTNAHYKADELRICNKAAKNLGALALKCGIDKKIVTEAVEKANIDYPHNRLGRMVSLCLRHNVPRGDILVSLMNIDGDNISTLLTAVRKFLSKTLPDGTKLQGLKCPECGEQLVMEAGCKKCPSCPWSACG